ncbi:MAG: alpha-2-macroglobulin family protein [Anaerolineales bacterium]
MTVKTDQNGLAWISLPESASWRVIYYVLMGQPGDLDFALGLTSWTAGLNGWDFGLPTNLRSQTSQLFTYLYSDRPIYRPGQTVHVRAILRRAENGRYFPSPMDQVTLQLLGDYAPGTDERPLLATLSLPVSSYGTASGSFTLPENAPPGVYTLQTSHEPTTSLTFQVAEYRKPEIELLVHFDSSEKQKGQDILATVQASYYFGAPASNLPVHWTLYAERDYFHLPNNYQSGTIAAFWDNPLDYYLSPGMFLAEGDAKTDTGGNLSLSFSADMLKRLNQIEGRQRLILEVTVQDQSEYPVSNRAILTIHPADFYIGARPDHWNGQVGQEIGYVIQTVDWAKKPSPMHALRADFFKLTWKQRSPEEISADAGRLIPEYSLLSSSDFKTDARGQARLAFIPPQPGLYLLEVSGNGAVTQLMTWVGGAGDAVWPDLPDQHLILSRDAETYQPGQIAHILIPNPFNSRALALVATERGRVMHTPQLLTIDGSSLELELSVADEDAPNIYLSVILLGRTSEGTPDFRAGYIEIPVIPSAYTLNVTLMPQPSRTMPGGEVSYKVSVTDSNGKPVQGEFSLAIVDKAILALTEPNSSSIIEAFYSSQPLGLETSLSLAGYAKRIALLPQAGELGGGEPVAPPLALREKLADTAYWQAKIETDVNGQAEITVKLPDNLTTWVATLQGLTKDTLVGEATAEVVTGKDLMIRPVTPAFLVSGDHIELAAVVRNNTKNTLLVDVSLQSAGFTLDQPGQMLQRITLSAGEQRRVSWWGVVQDTEQVELVFSAKSDNLQDSARPEQGKIPVLRYSVPQMLGVSGVLSKGGEKLEVVSLPRSYTPTSGQLRIEVSPSLAASLLSDLKAIKHYPQDFTEPKVSALLANVQMLRALQELGMDSPSLKSDFETAVADELNGLTSRQNLDGGWGWNSGEKSDLHTSAYVLYGLSLTTQSGFVVEQTVFRKAQDYVLNVLQAGSMDSLSPDELAFEYYVLQQSGRTDITPQGLYELREQMNPWAKALLALTLQAIDVADMRVINLLSELKGDASHSPTGVYWESTVGSDDGRASNNLTTAMVMLALSELEPQSPLVADAMRYLTANRRLSGGWQSSYETAWVIRALTNTLRKGGDLQADYSFSASLNDVLVLNGVAGGDAALTPISTSIPISNLKPDEPNALRFLRDGETGNLYYRAYLQLYRPVDSALPIGTDILLTRQYYLNDSGCRFESCLPVNKVRLSDHKSVWVHLTLTVPKTINYLVVEDYIPAGSEILNRQPKTTAKGETIFAQGQSLWYFTSPKVYADHICWMAQSAPPGVYELIYELVPIQAGEFHVLPAHAYAYYFPEVEGSSGSSLFTIEP